MKMSTVPVPSFTIPQYLEIDRSSEHRNEYYRGQIYQMAGASRSHNVIVANLMRHLGNHFSEKPCVVFPSHMRVRCPSDLFTYPDAVIVCGEEEYDDQHFDTLLNPDVLFEVLSPSTESYDRGSKSEHYRRIASLREYVLISQDRPHVEHYQRDGDSDRWILTEFQNPQDELTLVTGDVRLSLSDLYARVQLSPAPQNEPFSE